MLQVNNKRPPEVSSRDTLNNQVPFWSICKMTGACSTSHLFLRCFSMCLSVQVPLWVWFTQSRWGGNHRTDRQILPTAGLEGGGCIFRLSLWYLLMQQMKQLENFGRQNTQLSHLSLHFGVQFGWKSPGVFLKAGLHPCPLL